MTEHHDKEIRAGIRCFNHAEFWKAHEHWEAVWLRLEQPEKRWLQGLIQAAATFHLLKLDRKSAAQRLASSALEKLEGWPTRRKGSPLQLRVPGLKLVLKAIVADRLSGISGRISKLKAVG